MGSSTLTLSGERMCPAAVHLVLLCLLRPDCPYAWVIRRSWVLSFLEIGHVIFSTVILSLPLIQEGQICQFLVKECVQVLFNSLED